VAREDMLLMRPHEWKRLHLIHQALEKKINQKQAAEWAGLSARQMRRLMKRIRQEGDRGILHRRRGQPSNRRLAEKVRQKALRLFEKKYADFGPTLASEKLEALDRISIHAETLRLWLRQAQIPYKRRKARAHRQWRPRRSCFGEMVQIDGSHHDWLEGRGPQLVLMGYIDDATSTVHARFYDHEGTRPALDSFSRYVQRYGIPLSVYLDNHSTYKSSQAPSIQEQLEAVTPGGGSTGRPASPASSSTGSELDSVSKNPAAPQRGSHARSWRQTLSDPRSASHFQADGGRAPGRFAAHPPPRPYGTA